MTDKQTDDPYLHRLKRMPRPVRIICARPRLFISLAVGLAAMVVLPTDLRLATRLLVAWDTSIALYIVLALVLFLSCDHTRIKRLASLQDDGRFLILILTAAAAFASIAAIVLELGVKPQRPPQLILAVVTIVLSWSMIHSTFALHYAHEYYRGAKAGGLAFPGDDKPDYWDFVYFSFVIGMTAQVSDVGITDKAIRRTAIAHGIVSFIFNMALLALMVNIAASAI
ncbi:putative membrane protein [Nitrobacteraceae bacterium AZCC 1564]